MSEPYRFYITLLQIAVRYKTILFPFEQELLIRVLPQAGYVVSSIPTPPFGSRLNVSGEIAKKGDFSLDMNFERQILSIRGSDPRTLAEELDAIEKLLQEKLRFDSVEAAQFYELLAQMTVNTDSNPLQVMERSFGELSVLKRLSSVFPKPVTNFGVQLVPAGENPNAAEWFDVRIQPLVHQPESNYSVSVVFRSAERTHVVKFAEILRDNLERLLKILEG